MDLPDLAPVAADRDLDGEGDAEVGDPFHDLLDHPGSAIGIGFVGLEHELVVDREDHLHGEPAVCRSSMP